jgi:hypothetical protein
MNPVLQQYLDAATQLIDQFEKTGHHPASDILKMGRGIITQQDAEISHLKNELMIKSETIRTMLSTRSKRNEDDAGA